MSKTESKTQNPSWKWEINHDGLIFSYEARLNQTIPLQSSAPVQKKTLIDYWYIVHDGVVIPNVDY